MATSLGRTEGRGSVASTSKSADIVSHSHLIEFLRQERCEACVSGNRRCIIQSGDEHCMLCNDARRPCFFERNIRLRGRPDQFQWGVLCLEGPSLDADTLFNMHRTHNAVDHCSQGPQVWEPEKPDVVDVRSAHWPRSIDNEHLQPMRGTKKSPLWRKALLICSVLLAFYREAARHKHSISNIDSSTSGTHMVQSGFLDRGFDHHKSPVRKSQRRRFTESEKMRMGRLRKVGACDECRIKKRRCNHALGRGNSDSDTVHDVGRDYSSITRSTIAATVAETRPGSGNSHHSDRSQSPISSRISLERATKPTLYPAFVQRIMCPKCDVNPDGFRGEHELRRHYDRVHNEFRKVWVCKDNSPDNQFLAGCRSCRQRKKYSAYYNAAAHLRRVHFGERESKVHGGRKGGGASNRFPKETDPPMEVLKLWMEEIEERVLDLSSRPLSVSDDEEASMLEDPILLEWYDFDGGHAIDLDQNAFHSPQGRHDASPFRPRLSKEIPSAEHEGARSLIEFGRAKHRQDETSLASDPRTLADVVNI